MPGHKQALLMVALLVAPVFCCLVGAGAVVHLGFCLDDAAAEDDAANRAAAQAEREALQQELHQLQSAEDRLGEDLAGHSQRATTLERQLQVKRRHLREAQTEQNRLLAEINPLKRTAGSLDEQLVKLRERLVQAANDSPARKRPGNRTGYASGVASDQRCQAGSAAADLQWDGPLKMHPLLRVDQSEPLRQVATHLITSRDKMQADLAKAEEEHRRLQRESGGLQQKQKASDNTYEVPKRTGGHSRRQRTPVYVECTAGKVIVQPAGTSLSAALTTRDQSLLLAAARNTRYVVFLIRPDGISSFRRYRQLVLSENQVAGTPIDIGFEPVGADWNLVY